MENGNGKTIDTPISAVALQSAAPRVGMITVTINSKNYQIKLRQASFFDPVLLFAVTSPMVSQVAAASYTA